MHIGLVTPSWPGGAAANGIATAVAHLAAGLRAAGHEITVIPHLPADESDPAVVNLPAPRAWTLLEKLNRRLGRDTATMPVRAGQIAAALNHAIATRGVEVLIMEETNGIAGMVQQQVPVPVIVTLHGPWVLHTAFHAVPENDHASRLRARREGETFRICAGITAPSQDVLTRTLEHYGDPGRPARVIYNPMPPETANDFAALGADARNLLFVGRFDLHKGGDIVIEAFRRIAERDPEARLTFAGPDDGVARPDGSMFHIAEALAALSGAARARVDYRGKLGKDEIAGLRRRHGIALVASRYETFCYTAVEAMMHGMATVATAAGALPEILRDGETGLVVPPEDPDALAEACLRLTADPGLAATLGANAHGDAAARFAPDEIARQTVDFIREVQASAA